MFQAAFGLQKRRFLSDRWAALPEELFCLVATIRPVEQRIELALTKHP
ncbi:hypothetical protein [Ruminococcus sp.]|nr:hypothetical protein [Ruminococcus sp.]MCI5817079.1 hypothetical protein [Ruminococcus sp.]